LYTCIEEHGCNLIEMEFTDGCFKVVRVYEGNDDKLIQVVVSQDEKSLIGTFMFGYKVGENEVLLIIESEKGFRIRCIRFFV
jgi:hypothetical protein